ncbi:MAG: AI-2E family transporter [Eggerthellaceae bacterium]|nr:AI-2E family transporter [Eggerthellaceae bacterium]
MNENPLRPERWLPLAISLSVAVVVYVVLTHLPTLWGAVTTFVGFFSPVLLAAVIAYLVNPLANLYRESLFSDVRAERRRSIASNTLAFVTVFAFVAILLVILIPQLIEGVSAFIDNLTAYAASASTNLPNLNLFGIDLNLEGLLTSREELLNTLTAFLRENTDVVLHTSTLAGRSIIQWSIALLLSIYLLFEKERLQEGSKRLLAALLSPSRYETTLRFLHRCDSILNRYVVYNLLDSLIIGGANTLFMAVMGIPYIGLVSFVVAVFNLIPTFGPLIGAVIGALILSLVELRFTIIFLVFTAVLQLCDGYLVKPRLFGSSLGVSGLLILIGIVVGGRMFGTVGVLLAIPSVAILDNLYREYLLPRLEARRVAQG